MVTAHKAYTAVIFTSQRNDIDHEGYAVAAAAMGELVRSQPGYHSHSSWRNLDGFGVTISYWDSAEDARAWKMVLAHQDVQEQGASTWYEWYRVEVADVYRHYESLNSGPNPYRTGAAATSTSSEES